MTAPAIITGDCRQVLDTLEADSFHTCVTSPPYFRLRDYGMDGQIGQEPTPEEFIQALVGVFRQVRRVLRDDGTLWVNIGDSYAGNRGTAAGPNRGKNIHSQRRDNAPVPRSNGRFPGYKAKDLIGIPWMLAFALRADGWYLRQDVIWSKPNPMPESVYDRCTKSHEYLFLLSKSSRYYFDAEAISEPLAPSSVTRLMQDIDAQAGSTRVPGKANGVRKAVSRKSGNLERKPRPGAPADNPCRQAGSVPWEGDRRNKRSVWMVATKPFKEAHFATYPTALIEPCILAGSPSGGRVLDPFGGAGTTGLACQNLGREAVIIELNPKYAAMSDNRTRQGGIVL